MFSETSKFLEVFRNEIKKLLIWTGTTFSRERMLLWPHLVLDSVVLRIQKTVWCISIYWTMLCCPFPLVFLMEHLCGPRVSI